MILGLSTANLLAAEVDFVCPDLLTKEFRAGGASNATFKVKNEIVWVGRRNFQGCPQEVEVKFKLLGIGYREIGDASRTVRLEVSYQGSDGKIWCDYGYAASCTLP